MLIVDSQVHIWQSGTPGVIHDNPALPNPFTMDALLAQMQGAGVDRAILSPPGWDPDGEAHALDAARRHPTRFAVMANLYESNQEKGRLAVTNCRLTPGVLGLRFLFNSPQAQAPLRDGDLDWVWAIAEQANVPVMMFIPHGLDQVARIAERHAGLRLIVDHLAIPRGPRDDAAFAHLPELLGLARYPNVAVKAGAIPIYSTEPYPHPLLHRHLRRVFDAFGPRRMHWATDLSRMHCTYRQCLTLFTEELPWLAGEDLELVMGRAVCEWLQWKQ